MIGGRFETISSQVRVFIYEKKKKQLLHEIEWKQDEKLLNKQNKKIKILSRQKNKCAVFSNYFNVNVMSVVDDDGKFSTTSICLFVYLSLSLCLSLCCLCYVVYRKMHRNTFLQKVTDFEVRYSSKIVNRLEAL